MTKPYPVEKSKKSQPEALIEFITERSLADCLYRLRDLKHLGSGFIGPGLDPSFEKVDAYTYRFRMRRTWYDYRWRKQTWQVEIHGYLRALDNESTVVIASVRLARLTWLMMGLFGALLLASLFIAPGAKGGWLSMLPAVGIILFVTGMIYFDRRLLIRRVYEAFGSDV